MFPHREAGCTENMRFRILFKDNADSDEGKIVAAYSQQALLKKKKKSSQLHMQEALSAFSQKLSFI